MKIKIFALFFRIDINQKKIHGFDKFFVVVAKMNIICFRPLCYLLTVIKE